MTETPSFDPEQLLKPLTRKFLADCVIPLYPKLKVKLNTKPDFLYGAAVFFAKYLGFNPDLQARYITRIFNTIWVPENFSARSDIEQLDVMMHEATHFWDNHRLGGIPYNFLYASPQILAVLSLLSFGAIWDLTWLLWLLSLLFLLPIPSFGRAYIEMRAYQVNMMMARRGVVASEKLFLEYFTPAFTESAYYFMWPFKDKVKAQLSERIEITQKNDPWFQKLGKWLDDNNVNP